MRFVEVADRVWVARFEFLDVNVGLVGGELGLLMVDTNASEAAGRAAIDEAARLGVGRVVAAFNTHHHFDHCFGNVVLAEEYDAQLVCHEDAAAVMVERGRELQDEARRWAEHPESSDDPADATPEMVRRHREIAETRIVVPATTFSSARAFDLGDRTVELLHPGRGHTAGDAVLRVGDADVVFAGDLVEESALRGGVPGFGADCYPLEWPGTLDFVIGLLTGSSVVVPGHGAPVGKEFVDDQRGDVGVVAETIRDLAMRGVPAAEALASAEWPYAREELGFAVERGYAQLPRSLRQLPLL